MVEGSYPRSSSKENQERRGTMAAISGNLHRLPLDNFFNIAKRVRKNTTRCHPCPRLTILSISRSWGNLSCGQNNPKLGLLTTHVCCIYPVVLHISKNLYTPKHFLLTELFSYLARPYLIFC